MMRYLDGLVLAFLFLLDISTMRSSKLSKPADDSAQPENGSDSTIEKLYIYIASKTKPLKIQYTMKNSGNAPASFYLDNSTTNTYYSISGCGVGEAVTLDPDDSSQECVFTITAPSLKWLENNPANQ